MSIFVDTGVFYAHPDTDANRHDVATDALTGVLRSAEYGHVMASDYVYDECLTLTYRCTGRMADAVELGRRIRGVDPCPAGMTSSTPRGRGSTTRSSGSRRTRIRASASPT